MKCNSSRHLYFSTVAIKNKATNPLRLTIPCATIRVYQRKDRTMNINVKQIKSEYILGTQNGIDYHIYPSETR